MKCLEAEELGWGRFCIKLDVLRRRIVRQVDALGWGCFRKDGKYFEEEAMAKNDPENFSYGYGTATEEPATPVAKSYYDCKLGYSQEDTVDDEGYYAGYFYGEGMTYPKETPSNEPFTNFSSSFTCGKTVAKFVEVDQALGSLMDSEIDVVVTIVAISCSTDFKTLTDPDTNLILSYLSANLTGAAPECAIYAVCAAPAVRMLIQESVRQVTPRRP
jgi:hypothetical protein